MVDQRAETSSAMIQTPRFLANEQRLLLIRRLVQACRIAARIDEIARVRRRPRRTLRRSSFQRRPACGRAPRTFGSPHRFDAEVMFGQIGGQHVLSPGSSKAGSQQDRLMPPVVTEMRSVGHLIRRAAR